jgi:hypothetical protein
MKLHTFTGSVGVSFRRRAHDKVLADAEVSMFGLPPDGRGDMVYRRVSIMRGADGKPWVAWPRDQWRKSDGTVVNSNMVTGAGGAPPREFNSFVLGEWAEFDATAPAYEDRQQRPAASQSAPPSARDEELFS